MNINELPNEILLKIFKDLNPEEKLYSVAFVSKRWKSLMESTNVFKSNSFFEKSRSHEEHEILKHSERKFYSMNISPSLIQEDSLESLKTVVERNGKHLELLRINHVGDYDLDECKLVEMLEAAKDHTVALLSTCEQAPTVTNPCTKKEIIKFTNLKHMMFNSGRSDRYVKWIAAPQLQSFRLKYVRDWTQILAALSFLNANSQNLQKVFLGDYWMHGYEFYWKINRLAVYNCYVNQQILSEVCKFLESRCKFLTNVTLSDYTIPDRMYEILFGTDCNIHRLKANLNLKHSVFKNKSFPSVKNLMLLTFNPSNENIMALVRIFPCLEHLIISVQDFSMSNFQKTFLKSVLGRGCALDVCF